MHFGAQLASVVFALLVFGLVFEMVRRRRLGERYAILWLGAALALLVLAAWTQLLHAISRAVGIATPSNAFFVIAFAFLLLLLLHFSAVVSRLADETRVLAQRLALLEQRQRVLEADAAAPADHDSEPEWAATPAAPPPAPTQAGIKR
jgi:hypothetical protein